MAERPLQVAIIGAGIGGLTAAACLRRVGIEARIYEQARAFTRLGAGIQQSPNAVRVLFALGLEAKLRAIAFQPDLNLSRDHDTGALTNSLVLGAEVEQRHGAPYFLLHRGDLHALLADSVTGRRRPVKPPTGWTGPAGRHGPPALRQWGNRDG